MFNESVTTIKGMRLNAKIQAGRCLMQFTRIKLGNGIHEPDEQLEKLTELTSVRQEALISEVAVNGENSIKVNAIITNEGIVEGFYIYEIGIFAQDPDAGEILYAIATGVTGKMDYHPSEKEMVDYSLSLDMYITISNADKIKIETLAGAVASAEELKKTKIEVEKLKKPEFDDSGSVTGIAGFPDFLAKVKSKMDIFGFFRDFKAGMQFILHTGQIVNNCVSDRTDLPLAAKQGKVLAEELAKLNSDLTPTTDVHGSLLDFAISCKQGITVFCTGSVTIDAPFTYCTGEVFVRGSDFKIVAYNLQGQEVATNRKTNNMSNWEGWSKFVASSDLGIIQINPIIVKLEDVSLNGIGDYITSIHVSSHNSRWCTVRVDPKNDNEGYFGKASLSIMWNLSSTSYGWAILMSDNADKNFVFGRLTSKIWHWYDFTKTEIL